MYGIEINYYENVCFFFVFMCVCFFLSPSSGFYLQLARFTILHKFVGGYQTMIWMLSVFVCSTPIASSFGLNSPFKTCSLFVLFHLSPIGKDLFNNYFECVLHIILNDEFLFYFAISSDFNRSFILLIWCLMILLYIRVLYSSNRILMNEWMFISQWVDVCKWIKYVCVSVCMWLND